MAVDKLRFHYIKSNEFRVVHVDGAHGGLTPQGGIWVGIYSERLPIPESVVHSLQGVNLGPELREERKGKDGVVREVEVGLAMDLTVAERLYEWLGIKINELKAIRSKTEEELPE